MREKLLAEASEIKQGTDVVIFDCRYDLGDSSAGEKQYQESHIPGAHYLSLSRDLSGPVQLHGGRHPLPQPEEFIATLVKYGVGPDTEVIVYDDSRFAFSARLWWMMRSLDYRQPRLLNGGYQAWLQAVGKPETGAVPLPNPVENDDLKDKVEFQQRCDIEGLRQTMADGGTLIDSREEARYLGQVEPIDPVAGHIPSAINYPWQKVTDEQGRLLSDEALREHWQDVMSEPSLTVYCGSGVTACVNLFSLAAIGADQAMLYGGSWSDWCSYMSEDDA